MNNLPESTQSGKTDADICQCPKCLEVQERSEVCIKCGLIFKKYFEAEYLNKNYTHGASIDEDFKNVVSLSPRNVKFNRMLNKFALTYLIIAAIISIFDIGNLRVSQYYCDLFKILIPSLHGTSIISKDPNNTCLILALSWTMSIITLGLLIKWLIKQPIKESVSLVKEGTFFIRLLVLVIFIAVVALAYFNEIPKPHYGLISEITYKLIRNWAFTSALWGLALYSLNVFVQILLMSIAVDALDKCTSRK